MDLALSLSEPDEALEMFWQMVAFACRYGHQPILTQLGTLTLDRLDAFNEGLGHWLDVEKRSGSTRTAAGYLAEGGG